ncbi:hypothetical protein [Streptomyces sp. NPDC001297]|uniref:hypothetical protein n=1 Tax=Streptomyces sp. NPDC001297 TaxID=3364559 RepID=UPI0036A1016C
MPPSAAADPLSAGLDALYVLRSWDLQPPEAVMDAVRAAPEHLYQALKLKRRWHKLTPLDRADVHALRIVAEDLARHGPDVLTPHGAAHITPIAEECAHLARLTDPGRWNESPARWSAVRSAAVCLAIYQRLSPTRQAVVLGQLTPPEETTTRLLRALTASTPAVPDLLRGEELMPALHRAADAADEDEQPTPHAKVVRDQLAALPAPWQQHVMRRIGSGTTPTDAVAVARLAHARYAPAGA